MAQRGIRNIGCKRCVNLIVNVKAKLIFLLWFDFFLLVFIIQNQFVQLTGASRNLKAF